MPKLPKPHSFWHPGNLCLQAVMTVVTFDLLYWKNVTSRVHHVDLSDTESSIQTSAHIPSKLSCEEEKVCALFFNKSHLVSFIS